jgi:hypothetical protein
MSTTNGTSRPIEQPISFGWSPQRGMFSKRTWEAGGESGKRNLRGMANQLEIGQVEYELVDTFGKSRLTAIYSGATDGRVEVPITTWEVRVNRISKDFFQTPAIYELTNYTIRSGVVYYDRYKSDSMLDLLKRCVEAKDVSEATSDPYNMSFTTGSDAFIKTWIEAYSLALSGAHEFIVEQAVVVKTETVSNQYNRSALSVNVGKIFSEAQMLSTASGYPAAPQNCVETLALPSALLPPSPPGFPYGFVYGYRKSAPEMHQQAYNKWQMVTQWEQGYWATLLYQSLT